jgi:hypothetical protein
VNGNGVDSVDGDGGGGRSDEVADEARRVLGPAAGAAGALAVEPLAHHVVASATTGLWRVRLRTGGAAAGEGAASRIVKVLAPGRDSGHEHWRSGEAEDHWYYWRREALAYGSGLLADLPGGLSAPTCHLAAERADGSIALWLDDLASGGGAPATAWPPERYGLAARHLGEMQGAYVAGGDRGRPLPTDRWLSRGWLRTYVGRRDRDRGLLHDDRLWRDPAVAAWFPRPPVDELVALRADQSRFLEVLDRLPRTLAHLDLHPANLFDAPPAAGVAAPAAEPATVAVDWAFVGIGAVGEDPGNLVPDAVLDFHVPPDRLDDLHAAVVAGYHAGLRAAGWDVGADVVRLAMAASAAAKYAWIAPAVLRSVADGRPELNRRPRDEALASWAPVVRYLLDRADEARTLADRVRRPRGPGGPGPAGARGPARPAPPAATGRGRTPGGSTPRRR